MNKKPPMFDFLKTICTLELEIVKVVVNSAFDSEKIEVDRLKKI